MKKKYSFTLLEVMIASVLVGVVLSFLFTYFRQTLVRKQQLHSVKERVMQVELVRLRLTHLFDRLTQEKGRIESIKHQEADGTALMLYCSHGADSDPAFCKEGYAMLYKTREGQLALCRWDEEKKRTRVDILFNKVKDFGLTFFADGIWQKKWPPKKSKSSSPSMVKMQFKLQGKDELEQTFLFSLTSNTLVLELVLA